MTKGLGVLGSTEHLGVTGRLLGPSKLCLKDLCCREVLDPADLASSIEMENLGKTSPPCNFRLRLSRGEA